jgi:predicted nucleic acid-binding protein
MTVIVDANIIISALLTPTGKEASLIFNSADIVDFAAPETIYLEIISKKNKIISASHHNTISFIQSLELLLSKITIFSVEKYAPDIFQVASTLTVSIDEKDTEYVALTITLEGLLWTGDLKLLRGLKRKDFINIITTPDLEQILKGI